MITPEEAQIIVAQLGAMNFFPNNEPAVRATISRLVQRMCDTFQQAQWLVDRMIDLYDRWPGPHELRAVYCSRYKPADGLEGYSAVYPDGIPPERRIEPAHQPLALPPGRIASANPEADAMVSRLMEEQDKKQRRVWRKK